MDRGLQERLIGAAVLVALGVWLIPWVLDGSAVSEPSPAEAVALKLPVPAAGESSAIRRQTIELTAERGASAKTPPDAAGDNPARAQRSDAVPADDQQADDGQLVAEAVVGAAPGSAREPAEPSVVPQEVPSAAAVRDAAARSPTRADTDEVQPARTTLPDILAATPVAGWMVQLGSFSDAANARRQAQRIGTFGHDAQIYEFAAAGGRTMFRVRLGPLDTRAGAEATASSLSAHGFVAALVAPE